MGKIENVTRKKMAVEKSVEILLKNLVSEAIAPDGNQDHAVKAASLVKTLVEKESMLKDLNKALEKLEEEFIDYIHLIFLFDLEGLLE